MLKVMGKRNWSLEIVALLSIHPVMGWLGTSPDACVTDPYSDISEDKAAKKDQTPIKACEDPSFHCYYHNGGFHLKRNHQYYHQVQLQLFVGIEKHNWCDFVVYITKGIAVERIWLDPEWCKCSITELDSFYEAYMLPEILSPLYKPSNML